MKVAYALLKEACSAWLEVNAPSLGAALAFYTILSLAPVLIVAIAVAGLAFGRGAAEGEVLRQIQALVGETGTRAVQSIIQSANHQPALGVIAATNGIVTVLPVRQAPLLSSKTRSIKSGEFRGDQKVSWWGRLEGVSGRSA